MKQQKSTRDEFTKWLEDEQRNNQEVTPKEEATATAEAKAKGTLNAKNNANTKRFVYAVCIVLVLLMVLLAAMFAVNRARINKQAELWDANKQADLVYYPVYNIYGQWIFAPDAYSKATVLTLDPLPEKPEWFKEGKKMCDKGIENEQSRDAAKLESIKGETQYYNEAIAIGMALYEHPEEYSDEKLSKFKMAMQWYLSQE